MSYDYSTMLAPAEGWLPALLWWLLPAALGGLAFCIYYPPRILLWALSCLCQDVRFYFKVHKHARRRKFVALTLDDGPCAECTPAILDELAKHGARATMFVIGDHVECCKHRDSNSGGAAVETGRYWLVRMLQKGHELANHTWYDRASYRLTPTELADELIATEQLLDAARKDALGKHGSAAEPPPKQRRWFRPGHGWFSAAMLQVAQELGYETVLGSIFPYDPDIRVPLINALYIVCKVHPGGIIVLHDRRAHTAPTLALALPWLKWFGYEVVTLSEAAQLASRQ